MCVNLQQRGAVCTNDEVLSLVLVVGFDLRALVCGLRAFARSRHVVALSEACCSLWEEAAAVC